MITNVIIPSEGGDVCTISECCVSVGDHVNMGDLLYVVETDKTSIDVSAPCEGYVLALLYKEDDETEANSVIALLGEKDEDVSELLSRLGRGSDGEEDRVEGPAEHTAAESAPREKELQESGKKQAERLISPRAREYARVHGIELDRALGEINGRGIAGSITEADVIAYEGAREAAAKDAWRRWVRMLSPAMTTDIPSGS